MPSISGGASNKYGPGDHTAPPTTNTSHNSKGRKQAIVIFSDFHARMNHQGVKGLRKLAKALNYKLTGPFTKCIICAQGKARKNPFYKKNHFHRFNLGECWHLDCQGPFATTSRLKNRYALTAVEDRSGFTVVWLLPRRSDQWPCLKQLLSWARTQTGTKTKVIRADEE